MKRFLKIPKLARFKGDFAPNKLKRMLKDEDFKLRMWEKSYQNKRSVEIVTKTCPKSLKRTRATRVWSPVATGTAGCTGRRSHY